MILRFLIRTVPAFAVGTSCFNVSIATAGEPRCEELFQPRTFVAKYLTRQRLMKVVDRRSRSTETTPGGYTSISNPKPEIVRIERTSFWPLRRDTVALEANAKRFLEKHPLFLQRLSDAGELRYRKVEAAAMASAAYDGFVTGSHRNRMFIGEGAERVEISDNAIVAMAELIQTVKQFEPLANIPSGLTFPTRGTSYRGSHRDEINRIEHLNSLTSAELNMIQKAEAAEKLRGMKPADIDRWFSEVLHAARFDRGAQKFITAGLVLRIFQFQVNRGAINTATSEIQAKWSDAANKVLIETLIPRLQADFDEAVLRSDSEVRRVYFEVVEQIRKRELRSPEDASPPSTSLSQIETIYSRYTGRGLSSEEVAESGNYPLVETVKKYLLVYKNGFKSRYQLNDFVEFSRTGIGDREIEEAFDVLLIELKRSGYQPHAVRDALNLLYTRAP